MATALMISSVFLLSRDTAGSDAEGEGKFARLLDPDGHRIELWEHLSDGTSPSGAV